MSPLDICYPPGLTERMRRPGNYDYACWHVLARLDTDGPCVGSDTDKYFSEASLPSSIGNGNDGGYWSKVKLGSKIRLISVVNSILRRLL